METISIFILLILGVLIIFVEFFLVPGTTIVGFIGFGMSLTGIYYSYEQFGSLYGTLVLLGMAVFVGIALYISIKKETWRFFALNKSLESNQKNKNPEINVGDKGETISAIRPSGDALIKGKIYEIQSQGGFIDVKSKITVILVEGNKIYVQPI